MQEFEIINTLFKPLAGKNSAGLIDDCAFFGGYCVTKDILISGVHFFSDDAPYNLARKALRVNLSDLAASGAKPFGFMLGLALPKSTSKKWLAEFAAGLASDIKKYKFQMLGGDTCFHDGGLVISVTAIGKTPKPVLRSGAKAGDNIFVSGVIGRGYVGLQSKIKNQKSKILEYELPEPRVELVAIIRNKSSSCIDISDGLLADLGHICEESKAGAELFSDKIPLFDNKLGMMEQITGGDDYELLFTSKHDKVPGCYKIGKIIKNKVLYLDGKPVKPGGYEHKN